MTIKPIDTSIEILMKPSDRADDCPDVTTCQLELFENSETENASLILEDTEDELTKNLQIFLKKQGSGCDYGLRVGMVGGISQEYVLFYHWGRGRQTNVLFDIVNGIILDIDSYVSVSGSPAKPAISRAIISQNDAEWTTWRAWFEYNFESSAIAWDTEHPYPFPFDYSWTLDSTSSCNGIGYTYDTINSVTYIEETGPYENHAIMYERCQYDNDSYRTTLINCAESTGAYFQEIYDIRKDIIGFSIIDNISGSTYGGTVDLEASKDVILSSDGFPLITGGSGRTSVTMTFYIDGVQQMTETFAEEIVCNGDGATNWHSGTGAQIKVGEDGTSVDIYNEWYYQSSVGEEYVCTLGGWAFGMSVTDGGDRDFWFWYGSDVYDSAICYPAASGVSSDYYYDPAETHWWCIPKLTTIASLTPYPDGKYSITDCIKKSITLQEVALLDTLKEMEEKVRTAHLNYYANETLEDAPRIAMYKAVV